MERKIAFYIEVTTDLTDEELDEYKAILLRALPYEEQHCAEWTVVE